MNKVTLMIAAGLLVAGSALAQDATKKTAATMSKTTTIAPEAVKTEQSKSTVETMPATVKTTTTKSAMTKPTTAKSAAEMPHAMPAEKPHMATEKTTTTKTVK